MKALRTGFLILLIAFGISGCTKTPVLHVLGAYEGKTPDINKTTGTRPNLEKEIVVTISDDTCPLVVALMAYEPTHWRIHLKKNVQLAKVILGGYYAQRISGIPDEMPLEVYTHKPSPCDHCWQSGNYFYSYKKPPKELTKITGLKVRSFQGRYDAEAFSIFPGIKQYEP